MSTSAEPVATESFNKQAAKSRQTQDAIITATIELIEQGGLAATSAANIASQAGVSRGAVQHHCGGKQDIFTAIRQRAQQHFSDTLSSAHFYTGTLGQRVDRFVDAAWAHYQSAEYMAVMEILLAHRGQSAASSAAVCKDIPAATELRLWRNIFHEVNNSDEQMLADMQIVQSMLIGAMLPRASDTAALDPTTYLRRVKQILLALLTER